jgi:type III secretory pathway component EscR
MRRYVDGADDDKQSKDVGSVLDMFKELRAFLEKAKDSSEKSFFEWKDIARRQNKQAGRVRPR